MKKTLLFALLATVTLPGLAHADPAADVRAALGKVLDAGGFRAKVSGHLFGPDVPPVSGTVDVLYPDRAHVRSDGLEFIVTPGGAWIAALGYWTPTDRSLLPVSEFDPPAMRRAIADIRDVREEGPSPTAQCEARVYAFRATGQLPGAEADGDVRLWVCEGHGRPARLRAKDTSGGQVEVEFDWSRRPVVEEP